jgi:alkylation response protein AidB-like acyl-CoA dehydrogenase
MNFELSSEQTDLVEGLFKIAAAEFSDTAFGDDAEAPRRNLKRLAELGYLGMCMPVEVGGGGRPPIDGVLAVETLARVCPRTANLFHGVNTGPASFIARFGSEYLRQQYLPGLMAGSAQISISISEPGAGSDIPAMRTRARIDGDEVVIDGAKIWCSSAHLATAYVVYARFGSTVDDIACIVVDRDTPGLRLGPPEEYMSGDHYCELFFEDCRVPLRQILLRDRAFKQLMGQYSVERCGAAAKSLGMSQYAFDRVRDYLLEREQFGKPLAEMQGLQWMLVDMALRLEASRLFLYRALTNGGYGFPSRYESSMAKMYCTESAKVVLDMAMQLHGALGYTKALPFEYLYRIARGYCIAGGTTQIHYNGMAKELLRAASQRHVRHGLVSLQ